MDKVYLAPCPFCAGHAKMEEYDPYDGYQGRNTVYKVICRKCGASVKADSYDEAVRKWNQRAAKLLSGSPYGSSLCKEPEIDVTRIYTSESQMINLIEEIVKRQLDAYAREHSEERSED